MRRILNGLSLESLQTLQNSFGGGNKNKKNKCLITRTKAKTYQRASTEIR